MDGIPYSRCETSLPPPPPPPIVGSFTGFADVGERNGSGEIDGYVGVEGCSVEGSSDTISAFLVEFTQTPYSPMLAKIVRSFNHISDWHLFICEEKMDGERIIVSFTSAGYKYYSRILNLKSLKLDLQLSYPCIIDGELIYEDPETRQTVPFCNVGRKSNLISRFVAFDIQSFKGEDVRHLPLSDRKKLLEKCVKPKHLSKYWKCTTLEAAKSDFMKICSKGGEGLMLKRWDSQYVSGKRIWLKLKSLHLIEFKNECDLLLKQFIRDKNGEHGILECGYIDEESGEYKHVCRVVSGLTREDKTRLSLLLEPDLLNFQPNLIGTIKYDSITKKGSLRHPSFSHIRNDLNTATRPINNQFDSDL